MISITEIDKKNENGKTPNQAAAGDVSLWDIREDFFLMSLNRKVGVKHRGLLCQPPMIWDFWEFLEFRPMTRSIPELHPLLQSRSSGILGIFYLINISFFYRVCLNNVHFFIQIL